MEVAPTPQVLLGIHKVMQAFAEKGIAKSHKNESQGFKFRGIDDVMNRMAQHLVDAGLVIVPNIRSREVHERVNSRGNPLFYVTVQVDFNVFSTVDGSSLTCSVPGEAMDTGDKATNKALSIAYKYMAFQLFAIPVSEDADRHSPKVGTSKPITAEEVLVVQKLLEMADFKEEELLKIYEVEVIEMLPQIKLAEITKNLQKRIKQKESA